MNIIVARPENGKMIPRSIKAEAKKQIEKAITEKLGWHISILENIPIRDPNSLNSNEFSIYREINETDSQEIKDLDPQKIFDEKIHGKQNYYFGIVEIEKTKKMFVFLAKIPTPTPAGTETILLDQTRGIKVIVKSM